VAKNPAPSLCKKTFPFSAVTGLMAVIREGVLILARAEEMRRKLKRMANLWRKGGIDFIGENYYVLFIKISGEP